MIVEDHGEDARERQFHDERRHGGEAQAQIELGPEDTAGRTRSWGGNDARQSIYFIR